MRAKRMSGTLVQGSRRGALPRRGCNRLCVQNSADSACSADTCPTWWVQVQFLDNSQRWRPTLTQVEWHLPVIPHEAKAGRSQGRRQPRLPWEPLAMAGSGAAFQGTHVPPLILPLLSGSVVVLSVSLHSCLCLESSCGSLQKALWNSHQLPPSPACHWLSAKADRH